MNNINFVRPANSQPLCIVVRPGEVLCLYLNGHTVRVVSGHALVTWEGQEIALEAGEVAPFTSGKAPAVISATQGMELTLEVETTSSD
jgi:uncharacterized cupin superfamily protein